MQAKTKSRAATKPVAKPKQAKMTANDFYRALRKVHKQFDWHITSIRSLRGMKQHDGYWVTVCPITAVMMCKTGAPYALRHVAVARAVIGMRGREINCIVNAADNTPSGSTAVFNRLCKAVGLRAKGSVTLKTL